MPPATKLKVKDTLAQELFRALKRGEINSNFTGRELKTADHPLALSLRLYDTKSLTNVMSSLRKKLDSEGLFLPKELKSCLTHSALQELVRATALGLHVWRIWYR